MAEIKKVIRNGTTYDIFNSDNVDSALNTSSTNAIQNGAVATALDTKITNPSGGTAGQYLKKTAQGEEWDDIPKTYTTIQVTLTSAGWSNNSQTVTATGVTSSNSVIVSPDPSSFEDYTGATIYCSAQASNSLTFTCASEPSNDITVNVMIFS